MTKSVVDRGDMSATLFAAFGDGDDLGIIRHVARPIRVAKHDATSRKRRARDCFHQRVAPPALDIEDVPDLDLGHWVDVGVDTRPDGQ